MSARVSLRWLALAVALLTAAALLVVATGRGGGDVAVAQAAGGSDMAQRVDQIARVLRRDQAPQAHQAAIDSFFDIIWANMRILPTAGPALDQTAAADDAIRAQEQRMAGVLEGFLKNNTSSAEVKGHALDVKLLLEEAEEVARAVGAITAQCGQGADLNAPPCDQLRPLLDEDTGAIIPGGAGGVIGPGFAVKLRSPFVPSWFVNDTWEEDVRTIDALADGECAAVFKETKGLMLRLRFVTMTVVRDPWVAVFGVPRGTTIPIWVLEWVPAEYGKTWTFCNATGSISVSITKRVTQDDPLNFFWRYYPQGHGKKY